MVWIIWAAILNTVWTRWCLQLLPARIATRFGANGQAAGSMSRVGFAMFFILFPIGLAVFLRTIGGVAGSVSGMSTAMDHMAAGMILYFSFLSWCIVRSNRSSPPRIDTSSLVIGIVALVVIISFSMRGLTKSSASRHEAEVPIISPS